MIASWMLYLTAVGACLYVAARAAERVLDPRRGRSRWVWVTAIALTLMLPVLPRAERPVEAVGANADAAIAAPTAAPTAVLLPTWTVAAPVRSGEAWWALLWAMGSLAVAWRYAQASRRAGRLLVDAAAMQLAGREVWTVAEGAPALVGLRAPRIVVPRWLLDFDTSLQALVVAHEEEHRRAGDVWLVHALAVLLIALPWHLPLWLMARRLRRAIELDCDARVLRQHPDPQRYGRVLLAVAQRSSVGASLIAPALAEPVSLTEERIMALTSAQRVGRAARAGLLMAAVMGVLVACAAERGTRAPATSGATAEAPVALPPMWTDAPGQRPVGYVAIRPDGDSIARAQTLTERREAQARLRAQMDSIARTNLRDTVFKEFQVDRPVSPLPGSPGPLYPPAAKARGEEGTVLVQFVVRADSTMDPASIRVIGATNDEFTDAVRAALPRMRFRAAELNGKPVAQLVQQPFGFQISR